LQSLGLYINKLTVLPDELFNLRNLRSLSLNHNNLSILPKNIKKLTNLHTLDISHNNLTVLPDEIGNLTNLIILNFSNNKLTTIPITIINIIVDSDTIYYDNNPFEYLSPQVVRHLDKTIQETYSDNQSVHNSSIQKCVINSINYIMSIKPIYNLDNLNDVIIKNTFIDDNTKTILFEYINCTTIHSVLHITFSELLLNVLSFIDQHKAKTDIYKVLKQEINDTICKTFTGRMLKLIICLNGFDEHINISDISNIKQISNIIVLIKDDLITKNIYTVNLHKDIVMKELYNRGYHKNVIDEWISYI
jgi:hypothetical protein